MTIINQKSISGITSITTAAAGDNLLTVHTNDGSERLRITSNGKIGIGTASPTAPLAVMDASDPEIRFGYNETQDHRLTWDASKVFLEADPDNANGSSALGFRVDGTEAARFDSSGNFGIGEDSPTRKLVVAGDTNTVAVVRGATNGTSSLFLGDSDDEDIGALTYNHPSNYLAITVNASERMRIDSSGNLGLGGITSPTWASDGGIHLGDNYGIGFGDGGSGRPDFQFITAGDGTLDIRCGFGADDADITINSSGMVDVKSGDLRVTGGEGVSAALYLIADQGDDNGDDWRIISNQDANDLTISNNDSGSFSDLFTFTKAGHLGVGHGSPQFGITLSQDSGDIGAIGWEDGGNTKRASIRCNTGDDELQFHTGSSDSERMSIQSNGRVNMFHVYGTALSGTMRDVHIEDGGQLGYSSSTRDSKENISLLSNVDWLYQLQPSSFNYKKRDKNGEYTGEVSTELEYGLIAEDVEPIAPELCFYDEVDGEPELRGIHYKKLIVPMLKALQAANTKITTLEARVAALEG